MRLGKAIFALLLLSACLSSASASAAPAPVWRLTATSQPTNLAAGEENDAYPLYDIVATNVGGAPTSGPVTVTATLSEGIVPTEIDGGSCAFDEPTRTITCTSSASIIPGQNKLVTIRFKVGALAEDSTVTSKVTISGGGALPLSTETTNTITTALPAFGFLPGPNGTSASLNGLDGLPVTQAGSHPDQLTIDLGFPSRRLGGKGEITGAEGGLRDLITDLPRGMVGNPLSTPERCTEVQLEARKCPYGSAVGIVTVLTTGVPGTPAPSESPLFNMVPPPGTPAAFGFDAAGVGIFVHVKASVRSDGDYGVSATTNDTLARAPNPVLAAQAQLWGDPSDETHDGVRGACDEGTGPDECPVEDQEDAFLTMPGACSDSLTFAAHADSWIKPGELRSASAPITDAANSPTGVSGCGELDFSPTISAKPTTTLADSPSGLDVALHQPQEDKLGARATAILKDATLTLPEGMTVNPSQAAGLGACTAQQVGLATAVGEAPIHFSKDPAGCPDAAKIGSVKASTPLLDHPLSGAIYIAQPFQNPFGSLLAIYLTVEDPQTGIVAKLAGEVKADPVTGQLATHFNENPELPLEDVSVHLFEGARAPLRTPPACGTYTATTDLVPWSSPEAPDAEPSDSFQITAAPGGGDCPASAAAAPNSASFEAGTENPKAGAYSPFAMKLSRTDGTQPPAGFEMTLPPGLLGKAAGVPYCSEAEIAKAKARERPEAGKLEQADPSCPAASEIGTVDVGAGAGPTPFHTTGRVYFAGPYKAAPLSAVVITPAVAGPFDLGAVVVRAPLYVDPERAQVRTLTDPLPTILDGIPLDVRSVALRLGRPSFTLNPTSCEPMSIEAKLTSLFGDVAPLSNRFQVGGCEDLAYKPKLSLRLKGKTKRTGHPALASVFQPKAGQANTKALSLTLPRSEFIDQGHFRTICTRVQFAADQCPAGSIYGHATATTPLLEGPLEGPLYLRSSSHELPDVVLALRGQVDVVADGRVDSVNGGLRVSFEAIPDAPATKVVVKMKGAQKGLFINSADLCKLSDAATRAKLKLAGQNGLSLSSRPPVENSCAKKPAHKRKGRR